MNTDLSRLFAKSACFCNGWSLGALAVGAMLVSAAAGQCSQWVPDIGQPGANDDVNAVLPMANGDVIAGGKFNEVGGLAAPGHVARYNFASRTWTPLGPALGSATSRVTAIAGLPNGDFVVAGSFLTRSLARYNAAGNNWTWLTSLSAESTIQTILTLPGGDLLAAGRFTSFGGVAANGIARYNFGNGTWSALGQGTNNTIFTLSQLPDGSVFAAGNFTTAGGAAISTVAIVNPDAGTWSSLGTGNANANVYSSAVRVSAGVVHVIAGGNFSEIGGVPANRIASFDTSTRRWSGLGAGISGTVSTILTLSDGDVIAGGSFSSAGGAPASRIARYSFTTDTWTALGSGAAGSVLSLAQGLGGDVLVGGAFEAAGTAPAGRVSVFSMDGGPPHVVTHPISTLNCTGTPTTFSVQYRDGSPMSLQWRRNQQPLSDQTGHISGASTKTLTVSNVSAADAGVYDCVLTNACGTAMCDPAVLSVPPQCPGVIYVNGSAPAGNDGSSWEHAFRNLNDAMNAARVNNNGPQIWVAMGEYTGPFDLASGAAVIGGFAGHETDAAQSDPDENPTILRSGLHVVTATGVRAGTSLKGLTIRDGAAGGSSQADPRGSGVFMLGGSLTIERCVLANNIGRQLFSSNGAAGGGGGVYAGANASLTLVDCVLDGNQAPIGYTYTAEVGRNGGAVCCENSTLTLRGCVLSDNSAGAGGSGGCTVGNATAATRGGHGGGISLSNCVAHISECTFKSNRAGRSGSTGGCGNGATSQYGGPEGNGGAIFATESSLFVENCTFIANIAPDAHTPYCNEYLGLVIHGTLAGSGGAIYATGPELALYGCEFVGNTSGVGSEAVTCSPTRVAAAAVPGTGAAVWYSGPLLSAINCSFASNTNRGNTPGAGIAGAWAGLISNCVFWGNNGSGANAAAQISGGPVASVRYSTVQQWASGGVANSDASPLFMDFDGADDVAGTADDDLRLTIDSPGIDSGNSDDVPALLVSDLAGAPRRLDTPMRADTGAGSWPIVDRGAYEFVACGGCIGDFNCDGGIDGDDVGAFFHEWEAGAPRADVNSDGGIDGADVDEFFARWGSGC